MTTTTTRPSPRKSRPVRGRATPSPAPASPAPAAPAPAKGGHPVAFRLMLLAMDRAFCLPLPLRLPAVALILPVFIVGSLIMAIRMQPLDMAIGLTFWAAFGWLVLAFFGVVG